MTKSQTPETPEPLCTRRIIKASVLIADTRVLLSECNLDQTVAENLARAQQQNIFGKASRNRVQDILKIFRQRYFDDAAVSTAAGSVWRVGRIGAADKGHQGSNLRFQYRWHLAPFSVSRNWQMGNK